jgi:hypothetical protein
MPRNSAQQNNMSRVPTAAKLRGTTLMIIMPTWEDDGRIMPTWEDVATRGVMGQSIHGHRIQLSRSSIKKNSTIIRPKGTRTERQKTADRRMTAPHIASFASATMFAPSAESDASLHASMLAITWRYLPSACCSIDQAMAQPGRLFDFVCLRCI